MSKQQGSKAASQQIRAAHRREPVPFIALLLCCYIALPCLLASCSSSSPESFDEHRSPLNSEIGAQLFDKQTREYWSLGMTRDEVRTAAREARVRITVTEDARALREIDPGYDDRPALVARIIPAGLFIDSRYFTASRKVGYLYFFFDESERLRLVSYRVTNIEERRTGEKVRVILPEPEGER